MMTKKGRMKKRRKKIKQINKVTILIKNRVKMEVPKILLKIVKKKLKKRKLKVRKMKETISIYSSKYFYFIRNSLFKKSEVNPPKQGQ